MQVETQPVAAQAGPSILCTACRQDVVGLDARRDHYRSDLHRVNLKRKVAGLGPLTAAEFTTRVAHLDAVKADAHDRSARRARRSTSGAYVCEPCNKRFSSEKALDNHRLSRRCRDSLRNAARRGLDENASDLSASVNGDMRLPRVDDVMNDAHAGDADEVLEEADGDDGDGDDDDDDDDDDDVELADALDQELTRRLATWDSADAHRRSAFDDEVLGSPEEALDYMKRKFGFFVPFSERLVDRAALVRYIAQKVGVGFACIACDKGFASAEDAIRHMRDVGHCRVAEEHDVFVEEFAEYYDFGSAGGEAGDDDAGWEEVDEDEVDESAVMVSEGQSRALVAAEDGVFAPVGPLELGTDDDGRDETVALSVGSGKVVGHRSLARYYKQAGGRRADERAAVVANRGRTDLVLAKWQRNGDHLQVKSLAGRATKRAMRRNQRFELLVGQQNYYVRKSRFKQSFAVFNSGYRA